MKYLAFLVALILPPAADAASWNVDYAHSKLAFVTQWSGSPYSAVFRRWDAKISFNPADLAHATAQVRIDMSSAFSGEADLDQNLPGAQGFDVAHFPYAQFVTKGFRSQGADHYEAVGDLTIRGITKPITLPFVLKISGDHAHMSGAVTFSRIDFGIGADSEWAGEGQVAHAVKVIIDLAATRAK